MTAFGSFTDNGSRHAQGGRARGGDWQVTAYDTRARIAFHAEGLARSEATKLAKTWADRDGIARVWARQQGGTDDGMA